MPTAREIPPIDVLISEDAPSPLNSLGVKGAGEAGAIGSCPAIMNAIADALYRAHGTPQIIDMPATPQRVWQALRETERAHTM